MIQNIIIGKEGRLLPVADYQWWGSNNSAIITLHDEFCPKCKRTIFKEFDWAHVLEHEMVELAVIDIMYKAGDIKKFNPVGFNNTFGKMHKKKIIHRCKIITTITREIG